MRFLNSLLILHSSSSSPGSVVGIRSQHGDHRFDEPPLSERSSGDGGSEKEEHYAMSDEGNSVTEEIYATIGRRKRSERIYYKTGQGSSTNNRKHASVDIEHDNYEVNGEDEVTLNKPFKDNFVREGNECEELNETIWNDENKREKDSCSTFSNETMEEVNQACPAYFANLRNQYNDILIQDEDQDNTTSVDKNIVTMVRVNPVSSNHHKSIT